MTTVPLFDEQAYLAANPDVAAAVAAGHEKSGWTHFLRYGQHEGRRVPGFDPDFYVTAYPLAAEEIAAGRAPHLLGHYLTIGRARGYLPNPRGPRPDNAAALPNRFGGFWVDQPNAMDIVEGKLALGQIDTAQAALLRNWIAQGFAILPAAIPPDILAPALRDFDRGHAGKLKALRFECPAITNTREIRPWQAEMNNVPAKALDLHFCSAAVRNLVFAPAVTEFLTLLFDAPAFATQSLGFYRGSADAGHQDSAYVAYSIPRQFCASWIALEDVTANAGELFYYPGSHRFPDYVYGEKYKSLHEANRFVPGGVPQEALLRHLRTLEETARAHGMRRETLLAKKGDVLIWHADLVHGGSPISRDVTRKSVVTHYCPKYVSPLYAEVGAVKIYHHGPHLFASSYYKDEPAADPPPSLRAKRSNPYSSGNDE